ncbi:MAG: cation transporter [bacterium]
MKKLFFVGLSAMFLMAFVAINVNAGPGCGAHKADKADVTEASATMTAAECAKLCGMSPEECAKMCGGKENCGFTKIDVKGMTCGGCEQSLTAALKGVPGVINVVKVSHTEGVAWVCTDKTKCQPETLTKAITDKGYEAQIIPAVSKTTEGEVKAGGLPCAPGCPSAKAGGCSKMKKAEEKKTEGAG